MSIDRVNLVLAGLANNIQKGRVVRTAARILTNELVALTPIRDGIAKSNWFVSVNVPSLDSDPEATDQKPKGLRGLTARASDTIWVCNNLPYIVRLDNGWSQQAPEGFSQEAIKNTQRKADLLIKEIMRGG